MERKIARLSPAAALLLALPARAAAAEERPAQWMVGVSGGSITREGDRTRPYGSLALTRRVGRSSYVRASVTRFGSAVRQVDATLPSTYTIGFLSGGTTIGRWFADGYAAIGTQHYRGVRTDLGRRPVTGSTRSGVYGAGADGGYVHWLGRSWSLTPSASAQVIRSRALREQIGPMGPGEYETRETGATFGGTLRIDHLFGRNRTSSVGAHLTRSVTTNASAALNSGTRGALSPGAQSLRASDGWTEIGGNAILRLSARLYLDAAVGRTIGARSGDVTTTAAGARVLF